MDYSPAGASAVAAPCIPRPPRPWCAPVAVSSPPAAPFPPSAVVAPCIPRSPPLRSCALRGPVAISPLSRLPRSVAPCTPRSPPPRSCALRADGVVGVLHGRGPVHSTVPASTVATLVTFVLVLVFVWVKSEDKGDIIYFAWPRQRNNTLSIPYPQRELGPASFQSVLLEKLRLIRFRRLIND